MADIYTVAQVGRTQRITPEGFLLCEEVCIAKCDPMLYGAHELPKSIPKNGIVIVYREPDEVFTPESIASFEGKPIIITHGGGIITPDNIDEHGIGHMFNVRRGEGAQADRLFADLLITKRRGIEFVRGKPNREVSLGYSADYEQMEPGKARQVAILGNHLALVDVGRCGPTCAIGDAAMSVRKKQRPRLDAAAARQVAFDAAVTRLRTAFVTRDEAGLAEALDDLQVSSELDDGERSNSPPDAMGAADPGVNLTINVNGSGVTEGGPTKTTDDLDLGEAPKPGEGGGMQDMLNAALAPIMQEIAAIKAAIGMGGEGDEDDDMGEEPMGEPDDGTNNEDPDMTKDKKFTMDAAQVRAFHHDVMAKAAILIPGAKVMTLDGKMTVKQAYDATCNYRKTAVQFAATAPATAGIVQPILNGRDIGRMTCDEAGVVFDAAATMIRNANNGAMVHGFMPTAGTPNGAPAPTKRTAPLSVTERVREINERSRKRADAGVAH